ncbi:MAG: hypothetical protein HRU03_02130 [Nanoarchaeales archaeon]|nr:hypothetical protein [Nanoarchaeales archaeon]
MVSEKRLKGHGGKHQDEVSKAAKYGGMFLLAIMILSIVGFALAQGGGYSSEGHGSGDGQNFPLTESAFQDGYSGETYWGAVIQGERFIFMDGIEGFDDFTNLANLANTIKSKSEQILLIKIDSNFTNSDALYLLEEKLFPVTGIQTTRVAHDSECNENTLLFTNEMIEDSSCLQFIAPQGEEAYFADIFVYHMIK